MSLTTLYRLLKTVSLPTLDSYQMERVVFGGGSSSRWNGVCKYLRQPAFPLLSWIELDPLARGRPDKI